MHDIPELDRKGLRDFGLMFAVFIGGLFGLFFPWLADYGWPIWPWIIAAIMVTWALAAPMTLNGFYHVWMRFGLAIGAVVTAVILAIVFYGVVLPTGLLMRMAGNDPMARKLNGNAKTYRVTSKPPSKENMERPF